MRTRTLGRVLLILAVVAAAGPGPKEKLPNLLPEKPSLFRRVPHLQHSRLQPGIPVRDYVPYGGLDYAQPTSATSQVGILLQREAPPVDPSAWTGTPAPVRHRVKYYELDRAQLQVHHCYVSRVSLSLHETGEWVLSLQADQNPWMTGTQNTVSTPTHVRGPVSAVRAPIPNLERQTSDLRRNLFFVRLRGMGAYPVSDTTSAAASGKPVLIHLQPLPFWVQRGKPEDYRTQSTLPEVRQFFDLIDRVEVEFYYR